MTTNQEPDNRSINIGSGNYNESIQGDYIQGDFIQGSVIYVNKSLFQISDLLGRRTSDVAKPATQEEYKQRKVLLNKVKNYWIEGVLEKSLHTRVMISLGLEERLDAVEHLGIDELPDKSGQALPTGVGVTDVFNQMGEGRTLLILGEPGAGKTTTLLTLTKHLITRTEQDLSRPIPVVFNLSSWASKRQNIADWVVQELNRQYKVSKSLAKAWIKKQQLLLTLDGLDEVKSEYREDCVQALNEFMQKHGQTEIVVCSRIQDYNALSTRLQLQGAICVQSLTDEQIKQYLNSAGNQLEALRTLLEKDTALQELAKSPLTLSVMTLAYEGKLVEDLPQTNSIEEHRRHLFNTYIETMFSRKEAKQKYPKEQATRWLIWLAKRLSQTSQTMFLIEGLQPTCFQTKTQKILYRIGSFLIGGLLGGLIGALIGLLDQSKSFELSLLIGVPIGGLSLLLQMTEIKTVETLKLWSWQEARKLLINGLVVTLPLGLIVGLLNKGNLLLGVIYWLIAELILGLLGGLRGLEIQRKTSPNQGISNSGRNALIVGLIGGLIGLLIGQLSGKPNWVLLGLDFGLIFGLIFGGGKACIQHFTLRFILYTKGYIPSNYAHFLDYGTERIFLQKVGGGYIFVHRMLLEHFAQMASVSVQSTIAPIPQSIDRNNAPTKPDLTNVGNSASQPPTPVQNHLVCTNCGNNNPSNFKFCSKCGIPLIKPSI
ncbi:NACHT domain-containing protein [Hassallia byssoidea VB512170]|uniref:NACHT domain-containing protein n=1 Tax=Hassallia byssoidea VB512170 TaxID=1304833 RepID=A0A846H477_9CYAN|nr:NACHT domain-containing protein [Hassalia byssoidea]NEU71361.1 NACHT domain-containing protein [Hassalia byssoidea VB512170]